MSKQKKCLLWSLQHPDSEAVSYLFGTIHVWDNRALPIFEGVLPYLESCTRFAAESHLEEMSQVDSTTFYLPEEKRLPDFFSPKKYQKIKKQIERITKQNIETYEHLTPFVLTTTLSNLLIEKGSDSMDEMLWNHAKGLDKNLLGIETVEEQLAYYHRIPFDDQAQQLSDILKNVRKYRLHLKRMLERYLRQDIKQLYKNAKKGIKNFRQMMIYDRNVIMTDRIMALMQEDTIFVALGAGHLAGQKGILSLMKKKGYIVKACQI